MKAIPALKVDREERVAVESLLLTTAHLDRSYRLAGLILGDAQEAEDATQDALLRAWQGSGSLRTLDLLPAWFDRILLNGCRDRLRRRNLIRMISLHGQDDFHAESDPFGAVLGRDQAVRAMRDLTDDQRIIFILHYWEDLTLDDVARRLGCSPGTVRSRLNAGLKRIRDRLNREGDEGDLHAHR